MINALRPLMTEPSWVVLDHLDQFDRDDMMFLAQVVAYDHDDRWREMYSEALERLQAEGDEHEALLVRWALELADDPDLAEWFTTVLPADIVAEELRWVDIDARPYELERDSGPHKCGACGQTAEGAHLRIVDRGGLTDILYDLIFCVGCVEASLEEAHRA
jgi:hypothetical protein